MRLRLQVLGVGVGVVIIGPAVVFVVFAVLDLVGFALARGCGGDAGGGGDVGRGDLVEAGLEGGRGVRWCCCPFAFA